MAQFTLTGLGGCQEVGRSSFLLDIGDKIVLDRGVKLLEEETQYPLPVKVNLDAAIISHAHLDHSGDLPNLFLKSNALCYMTPPTLDVAEVLWHDTLKIAGIEGIDASFSKEEIARTKRYTFPVAYNRPLDITQHARMELFNGGHILGSALTRLDFHNKSFLYTGDFRGMDTRLHESADMKTGQVDYVVTEATYGHENHPSRKETEQAFVETVIQTLERGGNALVPAFAVGRAQEIVDILYDYKVHEHATIYYDGMAQSVARISMKYPQYFRDANFLKKALHEVTWVKKEQERKKALSGPSVIVGTAGMLSGGPLLYYIKKKIDDPKSSILLTGFQVKGTPGHTLLNTGVIPIDGEEYAFKGHVERFDFSGHADKRELVKSFKHWSPEKVIMVHGEPESMKALHQTLKEEMGIRAVALELNQTVKLD